ncbi:ribonuclease H [Senna tora]|uniref:Ribonuclease H n=1 Tax=Senna tora TaxID=362788 RepID=A0A834X8F0_9FABA|nr:ribonuclease H [Senna tora]
MLESRTGFLQKWNKEVFGDIRNRKNRLKRRLDGIQNSLHKKYNPFLEELGKNLAKELKEVLNQEEALWFQKSRSMWIRDGDRNTRSKYKFDPDSNTDIPHNLMIRGYLKLNSLCSNENAVVNKCKLMEFVDDLGQWRNLENLNDIPEERDIWKANATPSNKTLLWRLGHGKRPTRNRLVSWSNISPLCPLCGKFKETNIHLIRDCQKAVTIWNSFINPRDRACFYILPVKEWISWNLQRKVKFNNNQWNIIFAIGCSLIWKWRNKLCFENDFELPEEPHRIILHHAKTLAEAWSEELTTPKLMPVEDAHEWRKPKQGWIKINAGRAVCIQNKMASCGALLRDHTGKWICGYMTNLGLSNVFIAELWGIYPGLKLAWDKGFKKVIVESDSSLVVNQILGKNTSKSSVHPITQSIKSLLLYSWEVEIKYSPRSSNMCADGIAKKGLSWLGGLVYYNDPPNFLLRQLRLDSWDSTCRSDPGG